MNTTSDVLTLIKPATGPNWGTGCIILNESNQLLIIQRSDNLLWSSPGGTVDPGETVVEAIIREVKEESGLTIKNPKYLGMCYSQVDKRGVTSVWADYSFIAFIADKDSKVTIQKDEVLDYKWVYLSDLCHYNLFLPFRHSLLMLSQYPGYMQLMQGATNVAKMTSVEQLVSIKNPGKNGANGHIGANGNWSYDKNKPGSSKTTSTSKPATTTATSPVQNNLNVLKASYINYFSSAKEIKKLYQVTNGEFNFPNCATAIKQGIAKDSTSYWKLFKEQYMLYVLNTK